MHRTARLSIVVLMVAALILVPAAVMAEEKDPQIRAASMAGDVLVARPLGFVATIGGFGLFVVSSPFSLLGGNIGSAWNTLVVYPGKFTFVRPLGDFD